MRDLVYIFIAFMLISGCSKDEAPVIAINQRIIFQVEYTNYAWVYTHRGWIIDSAGIVKTFNLPKVWHYPDSTGSFTQKEMDENVLQLDTPTYRINTDTLQKYFKLLTIAQFGQISEPKQEMFDAGIAQYSGFIYNSHTGKYKKILIRQIGDVYIENKSNEASKIYSWLSNLHKAYVK